MPNGVYVTAFDTGVDIDSGQVQPVPRMRYQQLGYDATKDYVTWYVPQVDVREVKRGESGDRFIWNGKLYQVTDNNDWLDVDGWVGVVGVRIVTPAGGVNA